MHAAMRTPGGVWVVTSLLCACSGALQPDAGLGTQAFRFRVVQGAGELPVPNVAVRLAGPSAFVDGLSDESGEVEVSLASEQRPVDLTLARVEHGVLSIIGLTDEFPTQVRFDPTAAHPPTEQISGAIAGKPAGARVVVDSFDFYTTSSDTDSYQSKYVRTSGHALPVVAFEVSPSNEISSWTVTEGGARQGTKEVDLAFPSTPARPSSVSWSAIYPHHGLIPRLQAEPFVAGWQVLNSPTESWISTGAGSANRDAMGLSGNFTSVTGALAANRLILELGDGTYLLRHRQRELTPPISFSLPEVGALLISGSSLGDVSATATAPASAFDTFCIMIEAQDVATAVWRVCTAPGAPFSIPRLPDLPAGVTPSGLRVGSMLGGTAFLIDFEDQSTRPWQVQNSAGPLDVYRDTFNGGTRTLTGSWR